MNVPGILQALEPVVQVFEDLGIRYQIGGSVASSAYGIARATLDVDLVADLQELHIPSLVHALHHAYYIDEVRVRDAVCRRSSFNVIHLETMIKVDVFVLKSRPYDTAAFARGRMEHLSEDEGVRLHCLASPEDVVLNKLDWYRQGGCVSDRQWNDVLGILKVQQLSLDMEYLRHWAEALGLSELLRRALRDSGISF
jgi:predicted nucleotidyltransferase